LYNCEELLLSGFERPFTEHSTILRIFCEWFAQVTEHTAACRFPQRTRRTFCAKG